MFIYLQGHEEIVDLLIQNKVGVNIVDKNDRTALFWAAESGNLGQFLIFEDRGFSGIKYLCYFHRTSKNHGFAH